MKERGGSMKTRSAIKLVTAAFLALSIQTVPFAQTKKDVKADIKDETSQAEKAAKVFTEVMDTPDKGIPQNLFDSASCVAVFPAVLKAAFIVGGQGGRGVASCRTGSGWTSPAYLNMGGGSVGFQIGAEATDFVLLIMNQDGMRSLLSDKFTLGGDASVAAGPVGREAGASTDVKFNSQILSYSRSKGLFAGVDLKGVVISADKDDMKDVYGPDVRAKEVLTSDSKIKAPEPIRVFPTTLSRFSAVKKSAK
jgi:lipid-binding SYLF domain-containing protein